VCTFEVLVLRGRLSIFQYVVETVSFRSELRVYLNLLSTEEDVVGHNTSHSGHQEYAWKDVETLHQVEHERCILETVGSDSGTARRTSLTKAAKDVGCR
jgi:hypothetical protein